MLSFKRPWRIKQETKNCLNNDNLICFRCHLAWPCASRTWPTLLEPLSAWSTITNRCLGTTTIQSLRTTASSDQKLKFCIQIYNLFQCSVALKLIIKISSGLELFLSHTEKSCIALYYRQFSKNNKIKLNHKINFNFDSPGLWLTTLVLILNYFILISAESCL